jgi:hypothetical protein
MRDFSQLLISRLLVVALTSLVVGLSACENENSAACAEYVDYFNNTLTCAQGVDPGVDCNAFADYPCAVPGYFQCLQTTQYCEEAELSVCTDPEAPRCAGQTLAGCADLLDCTG